MFYSKPIIKIEDDCISVNPFLLLSLFTNSNYWVIRNYYNSIQSQDFTNDFGQYFEYYAEKLLQNCLSSSEYYKIQEKSNAKRADWVINIGGFTFLIEQKSSLSILGIKQNRTDIIAMKKYILKCRGEACEQLKTTQDALNINDAIKIVLLYKDYYKSECLEEFFTLNPNFKNDGKYRSHHLRIDNPLKLRCLKIAIHSSWE